MKIKSNRRNEFFLFAILGMLFCAVSFASAQNSYDEEDEENIFTTDEDDAELPVAEDETASVYEGPQIDVFTELSSDDIELNVPFAITVMVNHPNPIEVRVMPPDFEDNFAIERVRTDVQLLRNNSGLTDRWTCVEFLLIPLTIGSRYLGAFEVAIPGRTAATKRVHVNVQDERTIKAGRMQWIGAEIWSRPPESIVVGQTIEAGLRLLEFEKEKMANKTLPLRIEAPENAIIEELPVSVADKNLGIHFKVRILPLDKKDVRIASHSFRFEGRTLSVPALTIRVTEDPLQNEVSALDAAVTETANSNDANDLNVNDHTANLDEIGVKDYKSDTELFLETPFPLYDFSKFIILRKSLLKTASIAKKYWEDGNYAQSVASLRKAEKSSFYGQYLIPLRISVEKNLNIDDSSNESLYSFLLIIMLGIISSSLFFILIFFAVQKIKKGIQYRIDSSSNKMFKNSTKTFLDKIPAATAQSGALLNPTARMTVILCVAAFFVSAAFFTTSLRKNSNTAVLKAGYANAVPELARKTDVFFYEGEKATVRSSTSKWAYVETEDGRSGWVPVVKVLYY
ncbi:MAG: hypothetical protein Ta2F_12460 [Termitinemataceae bacterium]|nr:MAG: hypothetical protein Ta2F_12460 [Termitinemataceae bacterium]